MSDILKNDIIRSTDKSICAALQQNARTSFSGIAETLGMSVPAVSERVHKLENMGIIEGYHAVINHEALGYDVTAFIFVDIESSLHYPLFIERCKALPGIMECHAITGTASHLLKARAQSVKALEQLLSAIQRLDGVQRTITNLVLSTHIETMRLPLGETVLTTNDRKKQIKE
ncbi:Lrp/AsnC family transcriptional regulator [Ignavibacteria bacterium]|nr:Lrp/AsnC family transcriptional regulator [Bacteroidota bacterium]MCZ2131870.1 Lrp/AsnC family transcriptional regulator [Bacteroidota bacterium]